MGVLFTIEEGLDSYTKTEKKIAKYILNHPQLTIKKSANALAKLSGTSNAAIIRFVQRIGYEGLNQFKIELAKENDDNLKSSEVEAIQSKDSTASLISKSFRASTVTLNKTYELLNVDNLEKAIEKLKKANNIYLLAMGDSLNPANAFKDKLARINKRVTLFSDYHIQMANLAYVTKDDVVLVISYSGATNGILVASEYALKNNAYLIAITQFNNNPLSKIASLCLSVPSEKMGLQLGPISSSLSSSLVCDLLYLGIAKDNIKGTVEKLTLSDEIIDKL